MRLKIHTISNRSILETDNGDAECASLPGKAIYLQLLYDLLRKTSVFEMISAAPNSIASKAKQKL